MTSVTEEISADAVLNEKPPVVEILLFSWFDYLLFGSMLSVSALIGIYFGFCGKKQDNVAEYILGGKEMKSFPIAMSLITSLLPSNAYTPPWIFRISFYIYGIIGCTIAVLFGMIVSLITGGRHQKMDKDLLSPCIYFMLPREKKMDYKTVEHAMESMSKIYSLDKDEDDVNR